MTRTGDPGDAEKDGMKRLTKRERAELLDVLKANGMAPCNHPDCDPRQESCATNYVFHRARRAVEAAYRIGQGRRAAVSER